LIDKKHIKAPFSGVLGLRQVDLGEYLSPGTPLVQLQTLDPIYLNFTLPQKYLGQIAQGQKIAFSVKGWNSQKTFPGKITAIASQVQRQSRNIQIQATLTNPDQILRPGMYGQVLVQRSVKQQHVTLPQTSIEYNPYGDVVYILKPMNATVKDETIYKAIRRFVTTGQTRGDQVSIEKGVQPGDLVVTSGQQKLTEDSSILVNNSIQPQNEPSPQVKDK
jgi:membrane fusion protein (multidrug efflux system)